MSSIAPQIHYWADRITTSWRGSVEGIVQTGRLIAEAKKALPHGEFLAMLETKLPFCARTAQRLMAISADERIATHVSHLPAAWGALYELTQLDEESFAARIEDGTINPDMERKDITTHIKQQRRQSRERELGSKQDALPQKKYGVILADPEWRFEPYSRETGMDRAPENHYPTSDTGEISARDVGGIAADDCVLFLWATAPMLPAALTVMAAWGFEYKSHCIWDKMIAGTGYWFRNQHELLLVGTRGHVPAPALGTQLPSIMQSARSEHSAKPDVILNWIDRQFPSLPKIELNRRGPARPGWDAWGNEAESESLPPHDPETGELADEAPQMGSVEKPAPSLGKAGAGHPSIDEFEIPEFLRRTA